MGRKKSNKPTKSERITIRLEPKLYDQIVADAGKRGNGIASSQARRIIEDYYILRKVSYED